MAYVPQSGSVVAYEAPGSITSIAIPAGSITAVSATISAGSITSITIPAGSITAVSATAPAGSVLTIATLAGSIMSVSATQGTTPWTISSIYGNISGSVAAVVTNTVAVTNPAGSITAVSATAPAGSIMATNQVAGSVMAVATGSVAAFIVGSASVITLNQGSSILAVPVGSIISVFQSSSIIAIVTGSILSVGTQSSSVYGMRNDAIASFLGANLTERPIATDSAGRLLTKSYASEDATIISYVGSIVSGSVQLIQASVIGSKSYITDFWLSNTGASNTLVTFQDGSTSIVGQFIAPTVGGMSSPGIAIPLKTNVSQDLAFKVSPSTSVLYLALKGYQAP